MNNPFNCHNQLTIRSMASENNSSKMGAPMTEELVFDPGNQQPADARLFNRRRQTGRAERRRGKEGIELEKRLAPPPPPATWRTGGVKLAADVRAATERHWGRMTHGTAYVRSRAPSLSPRRCRAERRWNPFLKVFVGITPSIGSELNQSARAL